MNEDQLAAAEFAMDLAKGLQYVDQQTTNRPSQQPPALRTNVKDFVTRVVAQTRSAPSNTAQLAAAVDEKIINSLPIDPNAVERAPQIIELPRSATTVAPPQPPQVPSNVQQLELSFRDPTVAEDMVKTLKNIDITLTKILVKLNESTTITKTQYENLFGKEDGSTREKS